MTSRNLTVNQISTNLLNVNNTSTGTLNITSSASYFYVQSPNGRLTLTSGTPVTTNDVTAATTIYYTPYKGNAIQLYNGTNWIF